MTEENMTGKWQRIEYPLEPQLEYTEFCPKCNGGMNRISIPCPDGNPRCLVFHYGWMCSKCRAVWGKRTVTDEAT